MKVQKYSDYFFKLLFNFSICDTLYFFISEYYTYLFIYITVKFGYNNLDETNLFGFDS